MVHNEPEHQEEVKRDGTQCFSKRTDREVRQQLDRQSVTKDDRDPDGAQRHRERALPVGHYRSLHRRRGSRTPPEHQHLRRQLTGTGVLQSHPSLLARRSTVTRTALLRGVVRVINCQKRPPP